MDHPHDPTPPDPILSGPAAADVAPGIFDLKNQHDPASASPGSQNPGPRLSMDLSVAGRAFHVCPACAGPRLEWRRGRCWYCTDCGFEYFHNVAAAVGIIVETSEGILFVRRAREPARGLLGLPGGFVDPGESAESAALRECREETGWAPERLEYLASFPNLYLFRGIPYATCDLYFAAPCPDLRASDLLPDEDEASGIVFVRRDAVDPATLAFPSLRQAMAFYLCRATGIRPGSLSDVCTRDGEESR